MTSDLAQSKSSPSKLKQPLDAYQTTLLYNHINRLNLFQTIDQSLIFDSPPASTSSSLNAQSKLLAESSSSLDEDYNSDSDRDQEADEYVDEAEMRRSARRHHHHHHHHAAEESDSCDQEIINIFNIDDGSCLVSFNNHHHYFAKARTPTRRANTRTTPTTSNTNTSYLARPSLDFEKMIKVIIKDLSSI